MEKINIRISFSKVSLSSPMEALSAMNLKTIDLIFSQKIRSQASWVEMATIYHLELQGMPTDLQLAIQQGFNKVGFQIDSKVIEAWLKGKGIPWRSKRVLYEIQDDLTKIE
ncbi:hypothetical protein QJS10_CPB04g01648 [Acorus calamus]|uniref:Uncharacterized protein n=1 Tax=Acorus calamus TaxID=4465 RepID=A0AAV9F189_ACOCL|nr:hypothetical protein QJS10_CPB04g01648 [Acorus calamus]